MLCRLAAHSCLFPGMCFLIEVSFVVALQRCDSFLLVYQIYTGILRLCRLLERQKLDNGNAWPETIAVVLWGTDNIKTYGESLAQVCNLHTPRLLSPSGNQCKLYTQESLLYNSVTACKGSWTRLSCQRILARCQKGACYNVMHSGNCLLPSTFS